MINTNKVKITKNESSKMIVSGITIFKLRKVKDYLILFFKTQFESLLLETVMFNLEQVSSNPADTENANKDFAVILICFVSLEA